jgi:hypothetical protein
MIINCQAKTIYAVIDGNKYVVEINQEQVFSIEDTLNDNIVYFHEGSIIQIIHKTLGKTLWKINLSENNISFEGTYPINSDPKELTERYKELYDQIVRQIPRNLIIKV